MKFWMQVLEIEKDSTAQDLANSWGNLSGCEFAISTLAKRYKTNYPRWKMLDMCMRKKFTPLRMSSVAEAGNGSTTSEVASVGSKV